MGCFPASQQLLLSSSSCSTAAASHHTGVVCSAVKQLLPKLAEKTVDIWAMELQVRDLGFISGMGNNRQGIGEWVLRKESRQERGQEEEEEKVQAEKEEVSRNSLNQKTTWEHAEIPKYSHGIKRKRCEQLNEARARSTKADLENNSK